MKNRRLNVLFAAIIALAATPQAYQDAYSLVNDAHERVETEFWSIFLSYQLPGSEEAKTSGRTELMAARGQREEVCPVEPVAARTAEAVRNSQSNEMRTRPKAEARRRGVQENQVAPETFTVAFDNEKEVAGVYAVRPVVFSETEVKALKGAGLHSRDVEKIAEAASRVSLASSYMQGNGAEMKVRQLNEMNKAMRDRTRIMKEKGGEAIYEIQVPNTVGSM